MSASSTTRDTPQSPSGGWAYWTSAYFITVSALYLWGYWSVFHVNILEHIGATDILKAAAYPIASALAVIAVGAVLGQLLVPTWLNPPKPPVQPPKWHKLVALLLSASYFTLLVWLALDGPADKWRWIGMALAGPLAITLKDSGLLSSLLPHDGVRVVVLFCLAALPPYAYGHGEMKARAIRSGTSFQFVLSPVEGVAPHGPVSPLTLPRYLGRGGDNYFLYDPNVSSVVVFRLRDSSALVLKAFEPANPPSTAPAAQSPKAAASGA